MMSKKNKKLNLMVSTNAPWSPSGYAQQAIQFMPLIAKEGHNVACTAFYGLEGGIVSLDGITFYPKVRGQWGDDAITEHQKHFKPDYVFTLQDIWTMNPENLRKFNKWIPIVPIDHEPTPPAILDRLKLAYRIVTYSKFGYRQLKEEGFHSTYIPHTVRTDVFKKMDKKEARKKLGVPEDIFLFGMVAANKDNPPRKSFQEVMDAYKMFKDNHKDIKTGLYFHSMLDTDGGFPIRYYAKQLGIESDIFFTEPYDMMYNIPQEDMPNVYNMFDCLLAPSLNEGFGVPIIEAQACEVPVITNDFTAMRDLVKNGETGYKTKVASKRYTPLLSYVGIPDTKSLYNCMEKVFKADRDKMGKAGRKHVLENYDLELVWNKHWKPFLELLEKEAKTK